jgi:hypothetical protein
LDDTQIIRKPKQSQAESFAIIGIDADAIAQLDELFGALEQRDVASAESYTGLRLTRHALRERAV